MLQTLPLITLYLIYFPACEDKMETDITRYAALNSSGKGWDKNGREFAFSSICLMVL